MYLLDTNIISQTRRPDKADKRVTAWLAHTDSNNLYTSAVVMMELERGILGIERKDSQQGTILRQWLNDVVKPAFAGRVLPIDEATAAICAAAPPTGAICATRAALSSARYVPAYRTTKNTDTTATQKTEPLSSANSAIAGVACGPAAVSLKIIATCKLARASITA